MAFRMWGETDYGQTLGVFACGCLCALSLSHICIFIAQMVVRRQHIYIISGRGIHTYYGGCCEPQVRSGWAPANRWGFVNNRSADGALHRRVYADAKLYIVGFTQLARMWSVFDVRVFGAFHNQVLYVNIL